MLFNANIIDVDTGEIKVSSDPVTLQAIALGSCVALTVYVRNLKIGGLAHIMLPGKSHLSNNNTKYANDAIKALLDSVRILGADISNLEISMIGGANVLQDGDVPDKVIESVLGYLKKSHLKLNGMRVGGIERRSAYLDTTSGEVFYTEGDNTTKTLLTKIERI
ncbi:MAG: chemotaxis protein CheD [candidate division Zixibacteria bacterium]|nr:chemotaxis protein CheD [candidate division Zixibacteria bacterium]